MSNKYYTYAYLDEHNIPYYIGKGEGRRAYRAHDNVPANPYNVLAGAWRSLVARVLWEH